MAISFDKIIAWSKANCSAKSKGLCATYVKKAFAAGGFQYISGNGWENQKFCKSNGFQCIGDFIPVGGNPRATNGRAIQLPANYNQQVGDICLIKHGKYGHIVYAAGTGLNDWVSDFWQRPPGQQNNCGPYCYSGGYEHVQFWRHSSCMGNAPTVTETVDNTTGGSGSSSGSGGSSGSGSSGTPAPYNVSNLSESGGGGCSGKQPYLMPPKAGE